MEQVKEKLVAVDSCLEELRRKEKTLENKITSKSDCKKLSIF